MTANNETNDLGPKNKSIYSWYEEPLDKASQERLKHIIKRDKLRKGSYGIQHDFDEYYGNKSDTPSTNSMSLQSGKDNLKYRLNCELIRKQAKLCYEKDLLISITRSIKKWTTGNGTGIVNSVENDVRQQDIKKCKQRMSIIELQISTIKDKLIFHGLDKC